jgi:hemolysin activation/secretion protein
MRLFTKTFISALFAIVGMMILPPESFALSETSDAVPQFAIKHFKLEGNSLLDKTQITKILEPHTGLKRDFGDIQQAMEQLEQAYRDRGYTMVTVILPEQELAMGEVRLQAIEPRITEIKIDGNSHFTRDNILESIPTLKTGVTPRVNAISENLRAANENPARKIALQFKAQDNPEELHAALQVTDQKPWKLTLSGDNTGSKTTGDYRTGLGFQYFNLFNSDHVAALQYTTSPDHPDTVKIISGSYRLPFYKLGDTLDIFGAYSDVDSGTSRTAIAGVDAKTSGKGIVSGLRYNMNLPRSGDYEQKLTGGMDYRLYDNTAVYVNQGTPTDNIAKDVVAHPLSLTYGGIWTTDPLVADGFLGLLYNIPWGGLGGQSDFAAARSGASADYLIVRYGLNLMIRPGADWMIRIATTGQYTPDRLIPGEQFGYGGSAVLRGYSEREESWDAGFSGSLELYTPDIAPLLKIPQGQLRFLAFFDGGTGYNVRPQPTDPPITRNSLKSTGAGIRFGIGETFSFTMDWGYALDNSSLVASPTTSPTKRGGSAYHFKGQLSY